MPKLPQWDAKLGKALYTKGIPMAEIAKACHVNVGTLKNWAVRKKWSTIRQLEKPELSPDDEATLAPWLDARARAWIIETVTLLNKVTGKAARADIPEGWKGLREIVSLLKELIPAGRALYGLDQQKDKSTQQTAILVKVDVEQVGALAPERLPQAQSAIDVQEVTGSDQETANQLTEETDPLDGQPGA